MMAIDYVLWQSLKRFVVKILSHELNNPMIDVDELVAQTMLAATTYDQNIFVHTLVTSNVDNWTESEHAHFKKLACKFPKE